MNNLSWFIYLTQVADSASNLFGATSAILAGVLGFTAFIGMMARILEDVSWPMEMWVKYARWVVPIVAVLALVSIALPSRQTMLLIAGSEMGERIVKSDAVKDIVNPGADLLKAWIKDETDKITSKKK